MACTIIQITPDFTGSQDCDRCPLHVSQCNPASKAGCVYNLTIMYFFSVQSDFVSYNLQH